jgi:hypothetical protein
MKGVCRFGGCHDLSACPPGCYWVDVERTLCSACAPCLNGPELDACARAEIETYYEYPLELEVTVADLFGLIGAMQLAMRHPEFPPTVAASVKAWIEHVRRGLLPLTPCLAEIIARGNQPPFDVPFRPVPNKESET